MRSLPHLACQQCRRRKIRCDKRDPCSGCLTAQLRCDDVQRARRPRGRTAKTRKKDDLLEERVTRIENMLKQQMAAAGGTNYGKDKKDQSDDLDIQAEQTMINNSSVEHMSQRYEIPKPQNGDLVAPDFWLSLTSEVQGLREVLETAESVEEDMVFQHELENDQDEVTLFDANSFVFCSSDCDTRNEFPVPTREMRTRLLDTYRERVDAIYKILHWPSFLSQMSYTTQQQTVSSYTTRALEYAVYFMALCTITEREASEWGLCTRQVLLRAYRSATEVLLAHTRLLEKPDITALQALVIYLLALRTQRNNTLIWTLLAVAARVATALRLGEEQPDDFSAFDLEIRRRLLYGIGILDSFEALDRGTVPLMPNRLFHNLPLNINDSEMAPEYTPARPSSGLTEMSLTVVLGEAATCHHKIYEIENNSQGAWSDWSMKLELVRAFERSVASIQSGITDHSPPLHRYQVHAAQQIITGMEFHLRRPPYRYQPDAIPPWDDFDQMEAATKVFEAHATTWRSPEFKPWAWKSCVPWPPLAILLVEVCKRPWGPASEKGFQVASECFGEIARGIADTESGSLWRRIARLMRRAQRRRQTLTCRDEPGKTPEPTGNGSMAHISSSDEQSWPTLESLKEPGTADVEDWEKFIDLSKGDTITPDGWGFFVMTPNAHSGPPQTQRDQETSDEL